MVHPVRAKTRCTILAAVEEEYLPWWEKSESSRAARLTDRGFRTGERIGEWEIALRIVQQNEALCLELGDKDGLQRSYPDFRVFKIGC